MISLKTIFPELQDPELIRLLEVHGVRKQFAEGDVLMQPGRPFTHVPLILDGSIRVMREDSEGRELFLYYLQEGETCAVSLNCCVTQGLSEIRAIAETSLEVLMVPISFLDLWLVKFPCWKNLVMNTYRQRFEELLQTIDSIAFHKMDERLLQYLEERSIAQNTNMLEGTHQKIANELHSTREVISRLLKQLEKRGRVVLHRNRIELLS